MADEWFFLVVRGKTEWIAAAKREPFLTRDPLTEPGEVWFEFGATEAEALANLKRTLQH